jgi:DUF2934 family protein
MKYECLCTLPELSLRTGIPLPKYTLFPIVGKRSQVESALGQQEVAQRSAGTKRASERRARQSSPSAAGEVPQLHERIAVRAFEIFEKRGRRHGRDWEDWFRAEQEVLSERLDADLG